MSLFHRLSHLPFQTKVLLPVLTILIAMPIVTVTLVDQHVESRSRLVAEDKLTAAEAVLINSLQIRDRSLQVQFKNAVNEPRFKAVSRLNDTGTMRAYLRDRLEEFGGNVEALLYTPIDGSDTSAVRKSTRFDLADFESAAARNTEIALGGELASRIGVFSGSTYNLVSLPVFLTNSGYPIGSLSIAIGLGDQAIAELKSLTNTEIILTIDSLPVGSTLPQSKVELALADNEAEGLETVRDRLIGKEHFHTLSGSLSDGFGAQSSLGYMLLSSYESELQALQRTRLLLLAISLGGILFSAVIIYVLIRRITNPLRILKEGADEVGRGNLGHQVECQSNDECGDLAKAFNQMTGNLLDSHRELESTVTQLQDTQTQLIESEEGLRLIIEGARDHAIFTIDESGKILRWNAASERILGYTTDEARDLPYSSLFELEAAESEDATSKLLEDATSHGQVSFEGWRRRKDNSLFWADVTLSRLETGGFVEITRDITARKEAETAMLRARDAAEASDRAKSEFLANMSHEFRTPMNGIIGMTGLLATLELTEEQRDYAETIQVSAENLLSIIDDILDISRIEAGDLEIATTEINLVETIEDTIALFKEDCEKKSLSLHLVFSKSVPACVVSDANRLRQVLVNLVGNAVKFTEKGGVTVSVDYNANDSHLRIGVKDTGIGIEEEKSSLVFDPFYQVQSSASRKFGGTGLGLTIARNIAKLLDGTLRVESELGKGSTFDFEVLAKIYPAAPPFQEFHGLRCLLLVDDPISKNALRSQLRNWDIQLTCLDSPPAPVSQALARDTFDLLVVDQSATRPDTIRALLDSRTELGENFPPIIRLVSCGHEETIADGERCHSLAKPLSIRALNRMIKQYRDLEKPTFNAKLIGNVNSDAGSQAATQAIPEKEPLPKQPASAADLFSDEYPLRVLIVEDNPINTKILLKLLKKLGYTAETAENGQEGLAAAESMQFDVILMDLQMPVMDGLESARRILASESIEHPIYISAVTANALPEDKVSCKEAGMHDFVAKPVRIPAIKAVLQSAHQWVRSKEEAQTDG